MQAGGALHGGITANQQGKYEAALAKRNAGMEIDAARQSVEMGQQERRQFWREVGAAKGQQIASMAANGIDVDYGAGARMQDDTAMLAAEDAQNLYRNIEERTRGHHINAANYVAEAKAAKSRGKAALVGSMFQAATSLIGGFQQASAMKAKIAPPSTYGGSNAYGTG